MKYSEKVTVLLKSDTDAFIAGNKLKKEPGITGISVITVQKIKVKYDTRKTSAEAIAAKTGGTIIEN